MYETSKVLEIQVMSGPQTSLKLLKLSCRYQKYTGKDAVAIFARSESFKPRLDNALVFEPISITTVLFL